MGVCEKGHSSNGTKFCPECGSKMVATPQAAAPAWCADCGCKSAANFCPQCGKKKGTPPGRTPNFCAQCGLESAAKFCPGCGLQKVATANLGGSSAPSRDSASVTPRNSAPVSSPRSNASATPTPRASAPASSSTPSPISIPFQAPPSTNKKQVLCAACGQIILGRVLLAVDDTWHPACFTCVHCLKPQEGCPFYVQDNNVYCEKDHDELFALKCYGCKAIIDGQYLRVPTLGQIFHPDCLVCSTCKVPLKARTFFCDDNSDEILCQKDYESRKTTTRCDHCKEFITGSVVKAEGKQYHNKCYNILNPPTDEEVHRKQSIKKKEIEAEEIPDEKEEEEEKVSLSVAPPEAPRPVIPAAKATPPAEEKKAAYSAPRASVTPKVDIPAKVDTPAKVNVPPKVEVPPASATNTVPPTTSSPAKTTPSPAQTTSAPAATSPISAAPTATPASALAAAGKPIKPAHTSATPQVVHNTAASQVQSAPTPQAVSPASTPAPISTTPAPQAEPPSSSPVEEVAAYVEESEDDFHGDDQDPAQDQEEVEEVAALPVQAPASTGPRSQGLSSPLAASSTGASFLGNINPSSKTETKAQQLPPGRDTVQEGSLAVPALPAVTTAAETDEATRAANKTLSAAQKMNQMIESEDAIPFIMHGLKYVLHSTDDSEVFVPDYRKKEMYKLVTMDKKYDFQHYAPSVFRCIRNMFGVTQQLFYKSLVETGISGGKLGDGKSGMLFFYSNDRRFVIKTVTRAEIFFFKSILRNYLTHVVKNKHTLLPRFFGAYKITLPDQRKLRLVVMNNLFETTCKLDEKYDLKGSTRNRFVDTEKYGKGGVLKDLNFTDAIYMGTTQKRAVMAQLKKDTQFLVEENVMDQSLLIGIHSPGKKVTSDKEYRPVDTADVNKPLTVRVKGLTDLDSCYQKFKGGLVSMCDNPASDHHLSHIYFFGIIDILQEFNAKKRMESTYKCIRYNKKAISAVSSKAYATRFLEYMDQCIK